MNERALFIEKILKINTDIKTNWLLTIKFCDPSLENNYNKNNFLEKKQKFIFSFIFIFFIYVYIISFGITFKWPKIFFTYPLIIIIDIFLFIFFLRTTSKIIINIIIILKLFFVLFGLYLMIINCIYENFEESIIFRLIYVFIIFKNILYILIIPNNILMIILFYMLIGLSMVFLGFVYKISTLFSILNEFFVEVIFSCMSFYIRRYWELMNRKEFLSKYKFENFYNFSNDFLDEMDGLHFSYFDNKLIFVNKNLKKFLNINYSNDPNNFFKLQENELNKIYKDKNNENSTNFYPSKYIYFNYN